MPNLLGSARWNGSGRKFVSERGDFSRREAIVECGWSFLGQFARGVHIFGVGLAGGLKGLAHGFRRGRSTHVFSSGSGALRRDSRLYALCKCNNTLSRRRATGACADGVDQSSRRATETGWKAARMAGSNPPRTPMTSAKRTPSNRRSKVILKAKATLEKV